ncbi:uncharacterized protein LOC106154000 [Lingula anatina]|uniref:Uncharacterized protein LOC106154000 n=1 Tax=Lingula anatina TaxID=7574 RepID=A0A1S3HC91_LINAN|nr:uncharacterized protein LOC106154000 [Lingula anatina]|eukprot:XP_013383647.1 uncharacterized protein LOC106154000 [Lingula anatina]
MATSSSVSPGFVSCPGSFVDLTDLKCVDQLLVSQPSKEAQTMTGDTDNRQHPFLHHLDGEHVEWRDSRDNGVLDLAVGQYTTRHTDGGVDTNALRRERRRKQNDFFRTWWEDQKKASVDFCELNVSTSCAQTQQIADFEETAEKTEIDIAVFDPVTGTRYSVKGIQPHEMPVIGFYIDPRILPGFTYLVRPNGSKRPLFNGQALPLVSIGMGYGKRITFKGETCNTNTHFFWSDSRPEGYAFSLQAVVPGDQFLVQDKRECVIGHAFVNRVDPAQLETFTATSGGTTEKRVQVTAWCTIDFGSWSQTNVYVTGVAHVVKKKGNREATTLKVEGVDLPSVGACNLVSRE